MKSKIHEHKDNIKMRVSKHIFLILALAVSSTAFSQVIIGDDVGTVPAGQKTSVLLEFALGQNKGIILPYVRTLPTGTGLVEGTILTDATDQQNATVKFYNGGTRNNGWYFLNANKNGNITAALSTQPTAAQVTEDTAAKAIIGASSSSADGVLVLESADKAMVLPMVNSTNDIPRPAPGMMVYLNGTNKRLAVYNGIYWAYWAPEP